MWTVIEIFKPNLTCRPSWFRSGNILWLCLYLRKTPSADSKDTQAHRVRWGGARRLLLVDGQERRCPLILHKLHKKRTPSSLNVSTIIAPADTAWHNLFYGVEPKVRRWTFGLGAQLHLFYRHRSLAGSCKIRFVTRRLPGREFTGRDMFIFCFCTRYLTLSLPSTLFEHGYGNRGTYLMIDIVSNHRIYEHPSRTPVETLAQHGGQNARPSCVI